MSNHDEEQGADPHEWGEALTPASTRRPGPGDIIVPTGGLRGAPEPLVGNPESTPLEEDEPEGIIPPSPLWAMKEKRHIQWHLLPAHERHDRLRDCIGSGEEAVYVIDDGRHHATVGRRVGASGAGCEYCLVGRVRRERVDELRLVRVPATDVFDGAEDLTLCGIAVQEAITSSNVFDVARYENLAAVPTEYLPGSPFIHFTEDLEITAY